MAEGGAWRVTAGDDGTIHLWSPETGESLQVFEGHEQAIVSIAVSPDGIVDSVGNVGEDSSLAFGPDGGRMMDLLSPVWNFFDLTPEGVQRAAEAAPGELAEIIERMDLD